MARALLTAWAVLTVWGCARPVARAAVLLAYWDRLPEIRARAAAAVALALAEEAA